MGVLMEKFAPCGIGNEQCVSCHGSTSVGRRSTLTKLRDERKLIVARAGMPIGDGKETDAAARADAWSSFSSAFPTRGKDSPVGRHARSQHARDLPTGWKPMFRLPTKRPASSLRTLLGVTGCNACFFRQSGGNGRQASLPVRGPTNSRTQKTCPQAGSMCPGGPPAYSELPNGKRSSTRRLGAGGGAAASDSTGSARRTSTTFR